MSVFSKRYGYDPPREITFREELPANLRPPIIEIVGRYFSDADVTAAIGKLLDPYGLEPSKLAVLEAEVGPPSRGVAPVSGTKTYLLNCPWFQVYDVIERILGPLEFYENELMTDPDETSRAFPFRQELNDYLTYAGIGWRVDDGGKVIARGDAGFEVAVNTAVAELQEDGRGTAARQIHEALQALSRRPEPNFRGAIIHGMGALECIARDLAGDQKLTLGAVLKRHPSLLPKPVDEAISKLWGYASNEARHVEEGREPSREDAELTVGLAATISIYLTRKSRGAK